MSLVLLENVNMTDDCVGSQDLPLDPAKDPSEGKSGNALNVADTKRLYESSFIC